MIRERNKAYLDIALSYLFMLLPLDRNAFYFTSFKGQYSDSPRAISQLVHELIPSSKIFWEITTKCHETLPEYVTPVKPWTAKACYKRSRSGFVIDNYLGWKYGHEGNKIKRAIFQHMKKRGQINLSIWHGTPLKKISIDMPKSQDKPEWFYSTSDYLLCNSDYLCSILKRITNNKIPIEMTGWPRNDILFDLDTEYKKTVKKKLGLPIEKKIILYAPTFRDGGIEESGINQIQSLNIPRLLSEMHTKFGGDWIFVFRVHDSVLTALDNMDYNHENIYSGNVGDDMAEYLYLSDALITDYSGSIFDYLNTNKPCFLFCPDINHYTTVERGLYMDIYDLPYSVSITENDLIQQINGFNMECNREKVQKFKKKIGLIDDGNASKRTVEIIQRNI